MAIVEVAIVPIGTGSTGLSSHVAQCIQTLKQEDVKYELHPMGTIIEGDLDKVLAVIRKMHEVPFKQGVSRVITTIEIDDRRDKEATAQGKIEAVLSKL
jgi:uncharacterized protein (TIGR00106 family)